MQQSVTSPALNSLVCYSMKICGGVAGPIYSPPYGASYVVVHDAGWLANTPRLKNCRLLNLLQLGETGANNLHFGTQYPGNPKYL